MGIRGRRGIILGLALSLGVGAANAETYVQLMQPYNAALARLCPQQHLENMDPGIFNMVIDAFLSKKSEAEQTHWQRTARPMCKESVAGISCVNIAYVRAATKLGKIDELAYAACQFRPQP
jgi:hypothetical protein